ncbi:MAG: 6-carboxytetrahydropterin synthase [Bdellovibrionales bacterium]|nr:6-carboxytetrahydropterin synthase [Bdellovibrionales bacterium]
MLTISKCFHFCASHTLNQPAWSLEKNLDVFGKCANPNGHGHNYELEVHVGGKLDPLTNMIVDVNVIERLVMELIVNDIDHKNLNTDVTWLEGVIPTSEGLVDLFWERLSPAINKAAPNAKLARLVLRETSKICATRTE